MHDETAPIEPRGAYATSKRYGEEALLELVDEGLCPVILRNGTVYGYSPRMRFDLVVNTFVKDALRQGAGSRCTAAAGCGARWSTCATCADAMIAALEAPAELVRGEIFNVLHSNYQIRELAMLVAGSVQLLGGTSCARGGAGADAHARLRVLEREALAAARVHPAPLGGRGGRRPAGRDRPRPTARSSPIRATTTSAGSSSCTRSSRASSSSGRSCERLDASLITGGGGQLASDLEELLAGRSEVLAPHARAARHHRRRRRRAPPSRELAPDAGLQLRRVPQRRGVRARGGPRVRGQRAGGQAPGASAAPSAARSSSTSAPTTCSTARRAEPVRARTTCPSPRSIYALSKLAGEYAALAYAPDALVVRTAGLYGLHGSASKGGNFVTRMLARAREQGALQDGGRPAAAARPSPPTSPRRSSRRWRRRHAASSTSPPPAKCSWYEFTEAIMELAGVDVPVAAAVTDARAGRGRPAAERRAGPPARRRPRPHAAALVARGARGLHEPRGARGRARLSAGDPGHRSSTLSVERPSKWAAAIAAATSAS